MRKINYINIFIILAFIVSSPANLSPKEKDGKKGTGITLNKTALDPASTVLNANSITCWTRSNGAHTPVISSSYNGAYPKGTTVGGIYQEGIVWGGRVQDGQTPEIRVNGNTYNTGCESILDNRAFRVRPDFQTADLADDAASFFQISLGSVSEGQKAELQAQYEKDWVEWPVEHGAPYNDVNNDGVYEPDGNGNGIYGEDGEDIPGIPGASQTIYVAYNDELSATQYGCPPIGLEIHETLWAYAYSGALGNVIYKKVDLIYKGTAKSAPTSVVNDFYFLQWSDPDVGTSSNDYMGCDTVLNMGYAYNSQDGDGAYNGIGLTPASIGYDYLQGVSQYTGNPNDSAIFNLQWRHGYKYVNSKPMSSCVYFAAGGAWSDPNYDYEGCLLLYAYMRGVQKSDNTPFPTEVADVVPGLGTYLLAGDPVAETGKLDGTVDSPGDRRLLVMNGPVTLHLGDTAEVVIALVGGIGGPAGTDHLKSITAMKQNDNTAQIVFDKLFKLPQIPPPDVKVANLDNTIILDWGSNSTLTSKIEGFNDQDYAFEGYDVYQLLNTSSKITDAAQAVKIAQFDIVNGVKTILDTVETSGVLLPVITETGTDNGIKRYLQVTRDAFRGNQPLRNGQEYYFAVVPYAFNPSPLLPFHALQSSVVIKVGVPQSPKPGSSYNSAAGDTIHNVTHVGPSDGSVEAYVINPTVVTGQQYKVTFQDDGTWSVVNSSTGATVAANQTNQSGGETYPIVDGVMVKVFGPAPDFKGFEEVANANGPHEPTQGTFTFNGSGFPSLFDPSVDRPSPDPAGARWGIQTGNIDDESFSYAFFKSRVLRAQNGFGANLIPYDYELRFAPGFGQMAFTTGSNVPVPIQIWNVGISTPNDPSDDFQMIPLINDVNGDEAYALDGVDHPISGGDNDPETDWIYWYEPANTAPGSVGYNEWVTSGFSDDAIGDEVMSRMVLVNYNGGSVGDATFPLNMNEQLPAPGTIFRIISTKPNTAADVFTYTAPSVNNNVDAKLQLDKINVFPNPYYGFQYRETSRDAKYVTFSHLPASATIRIFDLSGVLVRTLDPKDPTSQFTTWNLQNDNNYPVASGIYIIHIDMPDQGVTKVLKLAVVQEEQILKVY